ncbi:MAG: LysM peptidoglycan-binding domain-containing protein, partial [Egibacteraceae bacterium]
LASIAYAEEDRVTLAGEGIAGTRLRAYVDDAFAREALVGADGRWQIELDALARGRYRLRVDALDAEGAVASRVETPFQREYPLLAGDGPLPATVTVQPGNNLWTIARVHYGAGMQYVQIFTANRKMIRDPDLIYPGQIFALPEVQER